MFLKKAHPYNAGYALPTRVLAEKEHRAVATYDEPRGAVDFMPYFPPSHPWSNGYAIPNDMYAGDGSTPELPDHYTDYMPNDGAWLNVEPYGMGQADCVDCDGGMKKWLLLAAAGAAVYFLFLRKR